MVWDRPELLAIAADAAEVIPYDAELPELTPAGARFSWRGRRVQLAVPGLHNAVNAAGALSACVAAGADPDQAVAAIADFQGARRRMQRLGESAAGAWVYDDYAHHPMKVAAAIAGAQSLQPRRLIVVFQPHLYAFAQVGPFAFVEMRYFDAVEDEAACIGIIEETEYIQESGLSAAGGAHDGDEFAFFNFEGKFIKCDGLYLFGAIGFLKFGDLDHDYELFR